VIGDGKHAMEKNLDVELEHRYGGYFHFTCLLLS